MCVCVCVCVCICASTKEKINEKQTKSITKREKSCEIDHNFCFVWGIIYFDVYIIKLKNYKYSIELNWWI